MLYLFKFSIINHLWTPRLEGKAQNNNNNNLALWVCAQIYS